jgi:hypothetical protein
MDPFIEAGEWHDFHLSLTVGIARQIGPQLPEHYQLWTDFTTQYTDNVEERADNRSYHPEASTSLTDLGESIINDNGEGTLTLTPPTKVFTAPVSRQRHLLLRDRRDQRLITAIEVLSPANKGGSLGKHLQKLETFWRSEVTTIDIDLLRGGTNPYITGDPEFDDNWPEAPYHVITTEPNRQTAVWAVGLTEKLPPIPIPLTDPDPPAILDLQRAFTELYTYSTYRRRTVEGLARVRPPLGEEQKEVLRKFLK